MNIQFDSQWSRAKRIAVETHKHLATWYAYLVSASVVLQESWSEFSDYVPVKWRHAIIGVATVLVIADKIRQSAARVG